MLNGKSINPFVNQEISFENRPSLKLSVVMMPIRNIMRHAGPLRRFESTSKSTKAGSITKTEFINILSVRSDSKPEVAAKNLDEVLTLIEEILHKGNSLTFRGFGRFEISDRKERNMKNIRTGEVMIAPVNFFYQVFKFVMHNPLY